MNWEGGLSILPEIATKTSEVQKPTLFPLCTGLHFVEIQQIPEAGCIGSLWIVDE